MTPLAMLGCMVALVIVLALAWRERSQVLRGREASRARAARATEVESIAADGANLLAAMLQCLELAREIDDEQERAEWVERAHEATRSLAALFEVLRAEGAPPTLGGDSPAEGVLRLGVALARSRGAGIALESDGCRLTMSGAPGELARRIAADLGALSDATAKPRFVSISLGSDSIRVTVPAASAPAIGALASTFSGIGWSARTHQEAEDDLVLQLRPAGHDASEDPSPAPRPGLVRA